MVKWAGWIIALAGIGHTVGSLVEAGPREFEGWIDGSLWGQGDYRLWSDAAAGFWYTALSFGPGLIMVGVTVVWLARRGIAPPAFVAWGIAGWVVITFLASGPSPLLLLLIASALLVVNQHRTAADEVTSGVAGV